MKVFSKNTLLSLFLIAIGLSKSWGQSTSTYYDAWFLLVNHFELNDNWKIRNEVHYRSVNFLQTKEQFIIRPSIVYSPKPFVSYYLGYSFINTYPFREGEPFIARPEHNFFEQVILKHKTDHLIFAHRIRLEHRFRGKTSTVEDHYEITDYPFSNRIRYRFIMKYPINDKWFLRAYDEVMINMNKDFTHPSYDRNWIYAGVGYKFSKGSSLQFAYLHQNIKRGTSYEVHPSVQLTYQYDILKNKKASQ